ncbi:hypothetical protein BASA81_000051 [Batrachochytrium salamandrivorans]|nr:hypothetical protein BASA81_000051 [Batrachochytrium salamandrivorans]
MKLLWLLGAGLAVAAAAGVAAVKDNTNGEDFFRSLDRDRDGDVDKEELERAIHEANGGVGVFQGVASALNGDEDDQLMHSDLVKHWLAMASLLSPDRVGEWLTHAVELPKDEADKFVQHNFTGLDLPLLLGPQGERTLMEMNVTLHRLHKTRLLGAIKLRMLNAGKAPFPPELKALPSPNRCGVILSWHTSSNSFPEVHKYRVLRRVARDDDLPENPWKEIYSGSARSFSDRPNAMQVFDYKLEAWNLMGKSEAMELHDVAPSQCSLAVSGTTVMGESSTSFWMQWVKVLGVILGEFKTALMSLNAVVAAMGLVYYYINVLSGAAGDFGRAGEPMTANARPRPIYTSTGAVSNLTLDQELESIKRTDSLPMPLSLATLGNFREKINLNRCGQCNRSVTRSTRHHCGECMRVFCIAHTALQPHMVVGNKVLTACGVNSKCRCFSCAEKFMSPVQLQRESNNVGEEDQVHIGSSSWKVVRNRILMNRTLRIWKRPTPADDVQIVSL